MIFPEAFQERSFPTARKIVHLALARISPPLVVMLMAFTLDMGREGMKREAALVAAVITALRLPAGCGSDGSGGGRQDAGRPVSGSYVGEVPDTGALFALGAGRPDCTTGTITISEGETDEAYDFHAPAAGAWRGSTRWRSPAGTAP